VTITLAFYKGRGATLPERLQDGAIRMATRGIYSHVELIAGDAKCGQVSLCFSASSRDGGVREKPILLNSEAWDVVALNVGCNDACAFMRRHFGARYDYAGILFSQVLGFGGHNPDKWFCSEICAAALGIPNPQRLSPQMLFDVVTWRLAI
jgi:hypothetical protein